FEDKYGVEFAGIRDGAVTDTKARLIQFKTNMDVAMSVLEKNGLGDWLADRIVEIGDHVKDDLKLRIDHTIDPFLDVRLQVANLPARDWSQQNQDSRFRPGVLHILAGHSGPETAADARTHFGIFSPQVWKLFPRGQIINLSFWDYNDVAAGYYAAAEIAAREK